jgi:parallel beta-helix repeat protein
VAPKPHRGLSVLCSAFAAIALCAFLTSTASAEHVGCGAVITQDTTLDSDLTDCPADGIVIADNGVDLNLNGHAIDGVSSGSGVRVQPQGGLTSEPAVHDGVVREFDTGVSLTDTLAGALSNLEVSSNRFGVVTGGYAEASISANRIVDNTQDGVWVSIGGATLSGNLVSGNGGTGITLGDFCFATIVGNTIAFNAQHGVDFGRFAGCNAERIEGNTIVGNGAHGLLFQNSIATGPLRRNVASRNGLDGILVASAYSPLPELESNRTDRNGDDGIDVDVPDVTLSRNVANRNDDLGIEAVEGTVDGGGNRARRNGNRAQCTGVRCR